MEEIYELQADVCKIFSNAKRLEIISILKDGETSANELIEKTGLSKANLSQHMAVLKAKGVILTRREGVAVQYRIANPKIIQHVICGSGHRGGFLPPEKSPLDRQREDDRHSPAGDRMGSARP